MIGVQLFLKNFQLCCRRDRRGGKVARSIDGKGPKLAQKKTNQKKREARAMVGIADDRFSIKGGHLSSFPWKKKIEARRLATAGFS